MENKKAYLVTFIQTVRIIANEIDLQNADYVETEPLIEDAFLKALEALSINGPYDSFEEIKEDTECPYGTFPWDKKEEL